MNENKYYLFAQIVYFVFLLAHAVVPHPRFLSTACIERPIFEDIRWSDIRGYTVELAIRGSIVRGYMVLPSIWLKIITV